MKKFRVHYYAILRELCGCGQESMESDAPTARALFAEVRGRHRLVLPVDRIRVAVNDQLVPWDHALADGDEVAFLPPVAGG